MTSLDRAHMQGALARPGALHWRGSAEQDTILTNVVRHHAMIDCMRHPMTDHLNDEYLLFHANVSDATFVTFYDELPLWSALFGNFLLQHVPLRPESVVLDIGCGTGFPLLELAQRLGSRSLVYGIDPWQEALERAREKAAWWQVTNVQFIPGDAAVLPLPDAHIDLVVSNLGINNFADPAAVLQECRRVCRPGGTLALTTNTQGHMQELYTVFRDVLARRNRPREMHLLEQHIAHRATIDTLTAQLAAAQFQIVTVVQEQSSMRFADGSALLRHFFTKLAFLESWKSVFAPEDVSAAFDALEQALNAYAHEQGELRLTIPMLYVEAT